MSPSADTEYGYQDAAAGCSHEYLLPLLNSLTTGVREGATVLDLGSGNGALLAKLQTRKWNLFGIDGSTSGVRHASSHFPAIDFRVLDVTGDLSGHPSYGGCDLVLSTEVVEHVYNPRGFAANCYNLLKPGGTLIVSTPYHGYLKNIVLSVTGKMDQHFTALWDHGHIKFWSRRTLEQLLREAGFRIAGFHGCGRIPYLWKSMVVVAVRPD